MNASDIKRCNTCKGLLGEGECLYQLFKNKQFLATIDLKTGDVLQECCEQCAQEAMEEIEEDA